MKRNHFRNTQQSPISSSIITKDANKKGEIQLEPSHMEMFEQPKGVKLVGQLHTTRNLGGVRRRRPSNQNSIKSGSEAYL